MAFLGKPDSERDR